MKTYKGNLGEYVVEYDNEDFWLHFALIRIIHIKPTWFNTLFPFFRTVRQECFGYGFFEGKPKYNAFIKADETEKEKMINELILTYENDMNEKNIEKQKIKETIEWLNN